MKKFGFKTKIKLTTLFIVASLFTTFAFVGCNGNDDGNSDSTTTPPPVKHTHNYKYVNDAAEHWLECQNVGCDAFETGRANHADLSDDGKCDDCAYVLDNVKGEYFTFKKQDSSSCFFHDSTYYISKISNTAKGAITIPTTYKNVPITAIGTRSLGISICSEDNYNVTEIIVPGNIKAIQSGAFYYLKSLESITVPSECLINVFGNLFGAVLPNDYNKNLPQTLKNVTITGSEELATDSFYNCQYIETVTLSNSITNIGSSAFKGCSALKSITLPENISDISANTFNSCINLKTIKVPNKVTLIGIGAFRHCSSLTRITIPKSVTKIRQLAFDDCTSLTNIIFEGTTAEWDAITKEEDAIPSSVTVTCLDDE